MGRYSQSEKQARFRRIAASRTDSVLEKLRILSNCASTQLYDYSEDEVIQIFKAIEDQLNIVKARFRKRKRNKFNWE